MGKVIHLNTTSEDANEFVTQLPQDMADEDLDCAVFVGRNKKGEWVTGWCAGFQDMAGGVCQLQLDLVDRMIRANTERYGLHTHDD